MKKISAALLLFLLIAFPAGGSTAQEKSVDEVARELANPNTALASLTFELQLRSFEGNLSGADDRDSTTVLFQPALPFPLKNGDRIIFRPAIPFLISQPVFSSADRKFDDDSGLGDISFDLAYAKTSDAGILTAVGLFLSLPTASDDSLGNDRLTLGPELLIGKLSKTSVLGLFPNHQWDIGGSGNTAVSLTTMQIFAVFLPGGGWNLGTSPIITFDHISDEWTAPLNLSLGKTVTMSGRPRKLGFEVNYYVEQPDTLGPVWMTSFSVAPVVRNALANWFK